jgi:hypothetical protein
MSMSIDTARRISQWWIRIFVVSFVLLALHNIVNAVLPLLEITVFSTLQVAVLDMVLYGWFFLNCGIALAFDYASMIVKKKQTGLTKWEKCRRFALIFGYLACYSGVGALIVVVTEWWGIGIAQYKENVWMGLTLIAISIVLTIFIMLSAKKIRHIELTGALQGS